MIARTLFEVVRYGSDETEEGADGLDTCFLVIADDMEAAVRVTDDVLIRLPHTRVKPIANIVHEIGTTNTSIQEPAKIIRGPYYVYASRWGWKFWERSLEGAWEEGASED